MTKIEKDRSLIVCFIIPPVISALNNITSKTKGLKKGSVIKMTENSSLSEESSSWNCLGTRMIVVVGDNSASSDVSSTEAMLIVHNENFPSIGIEDGGSLSKSIRTTTTTTTKKKAPPLYSSRLKLVLCTGRGSNNQKIYSHIINVSDEKKVKLRSNDDKSKLGDYFLQDDRYHPNIKIEFHYLSITKIKVDIKQKISTVNNHVMKNVYDGNLEVESDLSMLEFCNTYLGKPLNSAKSEIQELTKSLTKSEKAVNQWKDTAEKLDKDVWSKEKDRLLDGFLKLWNDYKSKAQNEIQRLKDELEKAQNAASKTATSKKRQLAFDNNHDAPDDLDNLEIDDELPIPMDVAERYAKGGGSNNSNNNANAKTKKKRRNPILNPNDTFSTSDLKRGQEEKKRKDAIQKQQREEAKAARAAAAAAAAQESQEQEEAESPDSKENTRPAKIARANNKKKQHDRNTTTAPTPDSDEDSDDIRLRMAIRANVKRSATGDDGDDDGFDSDLSY